MPIASINPFTTETLRTFEPLSVSELREKVSRAGRQFQLFRGMSVRERSDLVNGVANILETEKASFAGIMTAEMGKPLVAAREEIVKCAWVCRYYAEHAERFLADEPVATNASESIIRYRPLGPILAIMPWNFPFWQVFRFAVPTIMAGNVALLKHASNVPQCALAIEDIFLRAGFPDGVFQTLLIGSDLVESVLADDAVRGVSLTGSEEAGKNVAAMAGRYLKRSVLELGGSDPFIIMKSADIESAAEYAVRSRTINNGQSCIAAKRFIVDAAIASQFIERFIRNMSSLVVGDPMNARTHIGPLATADLLDTVTEQVRQTVGAGAKILLGGNRIDGKGYFYPPTILSEIPRNSRGFSEEIFGPVALLFVVSGPEEAVSVANDSRYGLGSSVWTSDAEEMRFFTEQIEAGQVFINGMVISDPRLPFGGVKSSGYGRELGLPGIREFVNVKTIWKK